MKLYPILSNKENLWNNWTNTVLEEINSKVFSLFQYISYFYPDYYEYDLAPTGTTINSSLLPLNSYYRVEGDIYDTNTGQQLPAGTLITSYARAEGESDTPNAAIRKNKKYYTVQPIGWASYYLSNFSNDKINFSYTSKAEENMGRNIVFTFETCAKRFSKKLNSQPDTNARSMSFAAYGTDITDINNWNIVAINNGHPVSVWTNTTSNPIMHFCFKDRTITNYGEEIIFDHTWETETRLISEVAQTNVAVYTINKKQDWPNDLKIEVI